MSYLSGRILSLVKQLTPRGRAWWIPPGSDFEKLVQSFGGDGTNRLGSLERLINDGDSTIDSLIPDNDNFTDGTGDPLDNDCNDGERRWHLIQYGVTSGSTPTRLQRMAAISEKMNYPGSDACRQTAEYLQAQLNAAGFVCTVRENLSNLSPSDILGIPAGIAMLATFELGEVELGETWADAGISLVANYIEEAKDDMFSFPAGNYHGAFYITGAASISTFANIPVSRKNEFRQLILKLKGAHLCAILFVHYV